MFCQSMQQFSDNKHLCDIGYFGYCSSTASNKVS